MQTKGDTPMKTVTKNCLNCDKEFEAPLKEIKRGNGKFCTSKCAGIYGYSKKSKPELNVECRQCGKKFHKSKSRIEKSKSGLFFCCRKCKDTAQSLFGGITEIQPAHYNTGNGERVYRNIAFRYKDCKCERCDFDNPLAIVVHHKDRDRTNNIIDNLEVLCCNCHSIEHKTNKLFEQRDSKLINWPDKEILQNLLWKQSAICVAKIIGVSGATMYKHIKKLNLSLPPKGYWSRHKPVVEYTEIESAPGCKPSVLPD